MILLNSATTAPSQVTTTVYTINWCLNLSTTASGGSNPVILVNSAKPGKPCELRLWPEKSAHLVSVPAA